MMNWPTAFVIAVAICAGAFLYNKPSDAAFGGSARHARGSRLLLASDRRSQTANLWLGFIRQKKCPRVFCDYPGKPTDDHDRHI